MQLSPYTDRLCAASLILAIFLLEIAMFSVFAAFVHVTWSVYVVSVMSIDEWTQFSHTVANETGVIDWGLHEF